MGQRSQIYIRYNVIENGVNYKGLIARYYSWNYGERMISRARTILEELNNVFMKYKWCFGKKDKIEKLKRICDINFDMRDIIMSSDIIKEVKEEWDKNASYIFSQDNNDGQLYIDITDDGIQYCFTKYCFEGEPMDAEQYMKWNCENENHPDWHQPWEYRDKDTILYTEKNIEAICKIGKLMSAERLKNFVNDDYDYLFV